MKQEAQTYKIVTKDPLPWDSDRDAIGCGHGLRKVLQSAFYRGE